MVDRLTSASVLVCILMILTACELRDPEGSEPGGSDSEHAALHGAVEARSVEFAFSIPSSPRDPEPTFHNIFSVQFGPSGEQIYVSDRFAYSIRVFDHDGRLGREFGRQGDGPGEFRRPPTLRLSADYLQAWDRDNSRITLFSLEGEYLGERMVDRDVQGPEVIRHDSEILMRGDHVLGRWSRRTLFGARVVARDGTVVHEHRYHTGSVWALWPGGARPVLDETFGPEGVIAVAGDSLYAFVDGYRGTVRWYRVETDHVQEACARDLGWRPLPTEVDEAALRRRVASERGLSPGDIDLLYPELVGRLHGSAWLDAEGGLWLQVRIPTGGAPAPSPHIVVSCDPSEPVRRVTFPVGFRPSDRRGDLVVGGQVDEETGVQSIRAYRVAW